MTVQDTIARSYTVSVNPPTNAADGYHIIYTLRGMTRGRADGFFHAVGNGGVAVQIPIRLEAIAQLNGEDIAVRWVSEQGQPEAMHDEFEQDVKSRVLHLHVWLNRLSALIDDVETWVKALDWSTRRIEKAVEDSQIGRYKAPSLIMQEGTDRVLLEPIARSAPGTEGVVDLYLMPAYDDIASLYYENGRWNLHYMLPGNAAAHTSQAPAQPLSKEILRDVLAEMKQHAA